MKRVLFIVINFLFSLSLCGQTQLFVSPSGNDKHKATINKPVKTIEQALTLARQTSGETTIYLREGTYRLSKPIILTSEDGNEAKKLTIRSFPNEHAIISGASAHNLHWTPFNNEIFVASLSDAPAPDLLCIDHSLRHMARYPNYDPEALRFNGTAADATSTERIARWKNPIGGYLHAMHSHDWGDFHYRITGKDADGQLTLEGGHQNNRRMGLSHSNRMVENIFEELDAPGEWFYDANQSLLYYYPVPDEDLSEAIIETPKVKHLVKIVGSTENPVSNITFSDITFTLTARTFMEPYEPLLRSDWTIYRGGAIFIEGAENCHIRNCNLNNLGGNGIFFSRYVRNSSVTGCHITQIGASAILFVGGADAVRSPSFEYGEFVPIEQIDTTPGPRNENYPADCIVSDNLIHRIGLFEKQITAVELSMCQHISVSHNSIYDVPRAGVNVSEGTWGGHVIEYNDIFDTVKETGDHGSFNSWGRDRFWHPDYGEMTHIVAQQPQLILADALQTTTIRYNRIRCDRGWDIDLDDGSSNYHIHHNLLLNGGIKLREGFYRIVENNILVNNTFHPHVWFNNSGDIFRSNIVMTPYQPIGINSWGTEIDYNIFTNHDALKAAHANGTDSSSVFLPLQFVNPTAGDYRVKSEFTDAFRIGFQNFPMVNFGVCSPRLKTIARQPQMPLPLLNDEQSRQQIIQWLGWYVKQLQTLGERSATGMDSERGIYVVTLHSFNSPIRDYLKANDVILKVNDQPTDNLDQFIQATADINSATGFSLQIFRNQQLLTVSIPPLS